MAGDNAFDAVAQVLSISDFGPLERALGHILPTPFKRHYVRYNGGAPSDTQVPGDDIWEPTEVAMFFSIKYPLPGLDAKSEMFEHFQAMRLRNLIPDYFLPFAWDPGGNFFGLDLRDGTVAYFATDLFDPGLSDVENFTKAKRNVARSFEHFLQILKPNLDANW